MGAIRRRIISLTAAAVITIAVAGIWWLKAGRGPSVIVLSSGIGKVEKVNLPDQSTVWLNGNTELVLHDDFARRRTIEIRKGEAFFEVREDKQHPFTVRSNDVNTVVLGTSFSVKMVPRDSSAGIGMNAGEGGEVKVSVKTGKVMVSHHNDTLGFVRPMQRLRYHAATGGAVIDTVLNGEADSWTHGELFLQNASLDEVMQWLGGHFPVTIRNERHTYAGTYYLQARSDINLPQVLKILNLLGTKNHVRFTQKDQTIIIQ